MKKSYAIFMAMAVACSFAALASVVDEESIKSTLARLVRFRHPEMQEHVERGAIARCNYDTNLYVRLAKEVAVANTNSTWLMLLLIGKYGSSNDLDFVSGYLKDGDAGRCAVSAFYDICGATSNSIYSASQFLASDSEAECSEKFIAMVALMNRFRPGMVSSDLYDYTYTTLLDFATIATNDISRVDRRLTLYHPSYSNSVERLIILTNAVARGASEYELRYLTNAIHHIELP